MQEIETIEREIDKAFADSELINLGYSQAVWTLLSVIEDHHFKIRVYNPLEENQQEIYVDGLLNALSYPLQICHNNFPNHKAKINRTLIDKDYEAASKWIDKAEDYSHFCSIFPLFHNGEIELKISKKIFTQQIGVNMTYPTKHTIVSLKNGTLKQKTHPIRIASPFQFVDKQI